MSRREEDDIRHGLLSHRGFLRYTEWLEQRVYFQERFRRDFLNFPAAANRVKEEKKSHFSCGERRPPAHRHMALLAAFVLTSLCSGVVVYE